MKHDFRIGFSLLAVAVVLAACAPSGSEDSAATADSPKAATTTSKSNPALMLPEIARDRAPDRFRVRFQTTKGPFVVEATRDWAPLGVDRFYNLVRIGFFHDVAFFRAVDHFIIQFGVHGDPDVNKVWSVATIPDDPPKKSNERGLLSFARGAANSRTTQIFINLKDNLELDSAGFVPIARVVDGMDVVDRLYTGYGELHPKGNGPRFQLLNLQGNAYLRMHFPKMDYIESAKIIDRSTAADGSASNR